MRCTVFIYTVYLKEYDGCGSTIIHMKSFKSLTMAETYAQELRNKKYDYDTDVCIMLNELY